MAIPPPVASHRKPKKTWLIWLLSLVSACVLFALFTMFIGVGPYDIPGQSRKLDEVLAESKRLGLPMTQDELRPKNTVPDHENAALEVMHLAEELQRYKAASQLAYYGIDEQQRADLESDLNGVKTYLDAIIREMEHKPGWYIERDYDLGHWLVFPEFAGFKITSKYLSARAVLRAEEGDIDGALKDLRTSRELRLRTLQEPVLIAFLVVIAIDAITLRASEAVMTEWSDDPASLERIQKMLQETDHRIDPRPALRGEFYSSLTTMRNLQAYGGWQSMVTDSGFGDVPQIDPRKLQRSGLPTDLFARASMTTIAELWNKVFQEIGDKVEPPRDWGDAIDERVLQMEDEFKLSELMAQIFFPVFSQADASLIQSDVNQDLHLALVKVLSYRAKNGRLPSTLEEAGASFPDPFNNDEPIKAILTEKEVRIWSVGRNFIDEDGLPRNSSNSDRDDPAVYWPATKRKEHQDN